GWRLGVIRSRRQGWTSGSRRATQEPDRRRTIARPDGADVPSALAELRGRLAIAGTAKYEPRRGEPPKDRAARCLARRRGAAKSRLSGRGRRTTPARRRR